MGYFNESYFEAQDIMRRNQVVVAKYGICWANINVFLNFIYKNCKKIISK